MLSPLGAIPAILKAARQTKGLSQRALAEKVGVPQGHISKIENGGVDLQTSSLIELARALDLEVQLVPRRMLAAVQAMERQTGVKTPPESVSTIHKSFDRLLGQIKRLEKVRGRSLQLDILAGRIAEAQKLPFDASDIINLQGFLHQAAIKLKNIETGILPHHFVEQTVRKLSTTLRSIGTGIAQKVIDRPLAQVPAYRVEGGDDA